MEWDASALAGSLSDTARREDLLDIVRPGGVGIELGVATGDFACRLLKKDRLSYLYGVDMYADHHNVEEYAETLKRLDFARNKYTLIRMTFDNALVIFPDNYFDFIYVDGYAHTGEEDGYTFTSWYQKLRPGGVFGGHDYDPAWPKVKPAVDRFLAKVDGFLGIIKREYPDDHHSRYASWFTIKK